MGLHCNELRAQVAVLPVLGIDFVIRGCVAGVIFTTIIGAVASLRRPLLDSLQDSSSVVAANHGVVRRICGDAKCIEHYSHDGGCSVEARDDCEEEWPIQIA